MGTEQQQAAKPVVAWIMAAIAVVGFLGSTYSVLSDYERRIALNAERNKECARRHQDVRDGIAKNDEAIRDLWHEFRRLPNPTTSDDWRRLESRVESAARLTDRVNYVADRIVELQSEIDESLKYYRDVMAPLVRHSNDLQAQRNRLMLETPNTMP